MPENFSIWSILAVLFSGGGIYLIIYWGRIVNCFKKFFRLKGLSLEEQKLKARILFVDDDKRFKVVNILKTSGWINTNFERDIKDLDSPEVRQTDIFFLDIQGVGIALGFPDEGLGLAAAIKKKYPNKKVVIYSAQSQGDRFHGSLRKADACLPKDASPYEFQTLLEKLSQELYG